MMTTANNIEKLIEELRAEAKNEESFAKVQHDSGYNSWGFKRTAEALKRYAFKLEQIMRESAASAVPAYTNCGVPEHEKDCMCIDRGGVHPLPQIRFPDIDWDSGNLPGGTR